jgi:hypothetical protein
LDKAVRRMPSQLKTDSAGDRLWLGCFSVSRTARLKSVCGTSVLTCLSTDAPQAGPFSEGRILGQSLDQVPAFVVDRSLRTD